MSSVIAALRRVTTLLSQTKASYALVGGFAVAVRAEPRFTRDVDLAVSVTGDAQAESLVSMFRGHGYQVLAVVEHRSLRRGICL